MRITFIVLLIGLLTWNCKDEGRYFDFGKINGNLYENAYFDMTLAVPEDWNAQADGEADWRSTNGYVDNAKGADGLPIKADIRDVEDAIILVLMEKEPVPGNIPGSITFMAESVVYNEAIKDGKTYLDYSKDEIIEMGSFSIPDKNYEELTVDGQVFHVMNAVLDVKEQEIYQSFCSTIRDEFALSAILTYSSGYQRELMIEVLKTIDFHE